MNQQSNKVIIIKRVAGIFIIVSAITALFTIFYPKQQLHNNATIQNTIPEKPSNQGFQTNVETFASTTDDADITVDSDSTTNGDDFADNASESNYYADPYEESYNDIDYSDDYIDDFADIDYPDEPLPSENLDAEFNQSSVDESDVIIAEESSVYAKEQIEEETKFGKAYTIQVASLKDSSRASRVVKQMEQYQFPVYTESAKVDNIVRTRVFVGPFYDSDRAKSEKQRLAEILGYEPVLKNYNK